MKKILFTFLIISTSLYAQNYEKNWNSVIENENNGKIQSANAIVARIHKKAIVDKNEVQIIKCFFYESKYLQVVDENAQTKIINNLKSEIDKASIASKAILNLVYAKCLNDYQKQNSYLIYSRTNTSRLDEDFLTWTNEDFISKINTSFENTLKDESILKAIYLIEYEGLFDFFTLEKLKKESLFDYLVKENIVFYTQKLAPWGNQTPDIKKFETELISKSADCTKLNLDS